LEPPGAPLNKCLKVAAVGHQKIAASQNAAVTIARNLFCEDARSGPEIDIASIFAAAA